MSCVTLLWGKAETSCPGAGMPNGQCSYTPQPLSLQRNTWARYELELTGTCRFQPDRTGYASGAGMVSIELLSPQARRGSATCG